jgi:hypothetical protein
MDWTLLTPEITLLLTAALFLVLACCKPDPQRDYHLGVSHGDGCGRGQPDRLCRR